MTAVAETHGVRQVSNLWLCHQVMANILNLSGPVFTPHLAPVTHTNVDKAPTLCLAHSRCSAKVRFTFLGHVPKVDVCVYLWSFRNLSHGCVLLFPHTCSCWRGFSSQKCCHFIKTHVAQGT